MKSIIALFAVLACAYASVPYATTNLYQVPAVIQKPYAYPVVVPTGVSHTPITVPNSIFSRTDWATPGNVYAVPAVAQYTVTKPGYTTVHQGPSIVHKSYVKSAVPVATVTAHQTYAVQQPIAVKTLAAPLIAKAYGAPALVGGYGLGLHGGLVY